MITIQTDKFTENTLSIRWMTEMKEEDSAAWNLLAYMLTGRCEKYPTRQEAAAAVSHAYGVQGGYLLCGYGQTLQIELRLTWIRESLIGTKEYEDEVADLLDQYLNHPHFDQKMLDEAIYFGINRIQAMNQDPVSRAVRLAVTAAGKGTPLAYEPFGTVEQMQSCTMEKIQTLYQKLKDSACEVLFAGECKGKAFEIASSYGKQSSPHAVYSALAPKENPEVLTEEKEISQSCCTQIYTTDILPGSEKSFALTILSQLLGSDSVGMLFEEVREKHSLCYSISCFLQRFDACLGISFGADAKDMDKAQSLIADIIKRIQNGDFEEERLDCIKREVCDSTRGQKDSRLTMIEQTYLNALLERPMSTEELTAALAAVTKEDIMDAAKGLRLAGTGMVMQKGGSEDEASGNTL